MPIPEEKSYYKRGMRVRPRRIEIHVDGERAGPPDGERGDEGPALFHIVASHAEGQKQAEESIERSGQGHGDAVRSGKTVGGDGGTESAREKDADMREEEKRRPENGGADGEMVFEAIGGCSKDRPKLTAFVEARAAEAFVGVAVVLGEIEIVLDERSAGKGVVADAIAAHPRVQKWKRENPKEKKQALRFVRGVRGRFEILLVHERGTRRKPFLSSDTISTLGSSIMDTSPRHCEASGFI